jgi:hypothetical protein
MSENFPSEKFYVQTNSHEIGRCPILLCSSPLDLILASIVRVQRTQIQRPIVAHKISQK